jgi:hypothetical protein
MAQEPPDTTCGGADELAGGCGAGVLRACRECCARPLPVPGFPLAAGDAGAGGAVAGAGRPEPGCVPEALWPGSACASSVPRPSATAAAPAAIPTVMARTRPSVRARLAADS